MSTRRVSTHYPLALLIHRISTRIITHEYPLITRSSSIHSHHSLIIILFIHCISSHLIASNHKLASLIPSLSHRIFIASNRPHRIIYSHHSPSHDPTLHSNGLTAKWDVVARLASRKTVTKSHSKRFGLPPDKRSSGEEEALAMTIREKRGVVPRVAATRCVHAWGSATAFKGIVREYCA